MTVFEKEQHVSLLPTHDKFREMTALARQLETKLNEANLELAAIYATSESEVLQEANANASQLLGLYEAERIKLQAAEADADRLAKALHMVLINASVYNRLDAHKAIQSHEARIKQEPKQPSIKTP